MVQLCNGFGAAAAKELPAADHWHSSGDIHRRSTLTSVAEVGRLQVSKIGKNGLRSGIVPQMAKRDQLPFPLLVISCIVSSCIC